MGNHVVDAPTMSWEHVLELRPCRGTNMACRGIKVCRRNMNGCRGEHVCYFGFLPSLSLLKVCDFACSFLQRFSAVGSVGVAPFFSVPPRGMPVDWELYVKHLAGLLFSCVFPCFFAHSEPKIAC